MSLKDKIFSHAKLTKRLRSLRRKGQKIAFTNGTFDLLHLGHVTYLEKAKQSADILVVGVNSDRSVKSYKDPSRPLNPELDRMKILAALKCVDYVTLFQEPTPLKLILKLKPDVLVKGADWKKHQIAGAKEVEAWGGQVKRIALVPDRSTTRLIRKLQKYN